MQIQFGENNTISNVQFGNHNKMYVENKKNLIPEEYWRELTQILNFLLDKGELKGETETVAKDVLGYVNQENENGLIGALKRNKETFFTNILSNVASSGLVLLLTKLCV